MKSLLFIITLCYIGRFIDAHGENDENSNLSSDKSEAEITEENLSKESEQSNDADKSDSKGGENASESESSEQETREEKKEKKQLSRKDGDGGGGGLESSNDEKRYKQYEEAMLRWMTEIEAGDKADLIGQNEHVVQSNFYNDLGRRSVAQGLKNNAAENDDYLTPEKAPPEVVLLVAKESALLRSGKDTDLGSDFDRKKILRSGDYWNGVWKEEVHPKSAMRSTSLKKNLAVKNVAAENVDYLTPEKAPPELVLLVAKESALLRSGKDTDLESDFDRKKILRSGDYWNGVWKEDVHPKSAMRSTSLKKKLGSIKAKIKPGTEFYKVVSRMKKISPQLLYIINKKQPLDF